MKNDPFIQSFIQQRRERGLLKLDQLNINFPEIKKTARKSAFQITPTGTKCQF
jgi:hypothetical protein